MKGCWVFVCGPSGAGKDSVIAWAREALAHRCDIVFAQRLVTRPAAAGSDHEAVTQRDFEALAHRRALAWQWQAHGFHYGVGARYAQQVAWGRVVVVNGSRAHAAGLPAAADVHRVVVQARPDRIAERLRRRGREDSDAIARRLERNSGLAPMPADCVIHNDGDLALGGAALQHYLEGLVQHGA